MFFSFPSRSRVRIFQIAFAWLIANPMDKPHILLGRIGTSTHDFRRCLAVRSPMHLVLNRCEEPLRGVRTGIIIDTADPFWAHI